MDSVFVLHDIWVFSWEDPKLGVTQWLGVTHYLEASVLRYITSDAWLLSWGSQQNAYSDDFCEV